jgi:hypothetical protein
MSKGGSQTTNTSTEIPKWLQEAAQQALARSQQAANIGYVPYSGPSVAAFTPMQNDAFQSTNQAARAYGMPTSQGNGMPKAETFAGGVRGYSSMPLYEQALNSLQQSNPQQYAELTRMFQGGRGNRQQTPGLLAPKGK